MNIGLTVGDLVGDRSLDTRVISGGGGLARIVLWAHSCELGDPARWLGPHELLMTVGLAIPDAEDDQRALIASLDEAGVAGMTVGEHGFAPALTRGMREESDLRGFPLLVTGPDVAFAALGRTVAAAATEQRTMGVLMLSKLYQRAVNRSPEQIRSGRSLSDVVGTELTVVDTATGCVLIGGGVHTDGLEGRRHDLASRRPSQLIVRDDGRLDGFSLMHLSQIFALDADSVYQQVSEELHAGGGALDLALRGEGAALEASEDGRFTRSGYRILVTRDPVPGRAALAMVLSGITSVVTDLNGLSAAVVAQQEIGEAAQLLQELGVTAGCSSEYRRAVDASGAVEEARSEYRIAEQRGERWREFTGSRVSLLARSETEAQDICDLVLGPLTEPGGKNGVLRETLFAFLDSDMNWSKTAAVVGLHRQGLVYRLKRVEELTGRSVRRTRDLSELWLARSAWERLQGGPDH